jgi:hypothetical protein
MKNNLNVASVLCTIGSGLFALTTFGTAYRSLMWLGVLLFALGIAAAINTVFVTGFELVLRSFRSKTIERKFERVYATMTDVAPLRALYAKEFGSEVPSAKLMLEWITRYPHAFTLLYRCDAKPLFRRIYTLVGSFKLLPITSEGVREVEAGRATGSTLKSEHVAGEWADASALYIGDVVGTSLLGKGILLHYLNAACEEAFEKGLPLYARPLTPDGKRVMTGHAFVQIADGTSPPEIGKMCRLGGDELGKFNDNLRRNSERGRKQLPQGTRQGKRLLQTVAHPTVVLAMR